MHQHSKNIVYGGLPLEHASKVMIMIHGRGATAESILTLGDHLAVEHFALLAPQATLNTWYPYSFMAPVTQNEPGLSTALEVLKETVAEVLKLGFETADIYLLGFSQGACLASEFVARNAQKYGGVFVLSGGVIGDKINTDNYNGNFNNTPIFLGCSDVDAHIPEQRVHDSSAIFEKMGAKVNKQIYPNMPHTIVQEELDIVNDILTGKG